MKEDISEAERYGWTDSQYLYEGDDEGVTRGPLSSTSSGDTDIWTKCRRIYAHE
jgi:hypothetical protein